MTVAEALGYTASLLVFTTFYMKTMIPLRMVAIGSNVVFVAYGFLELLYPVMLLHATLLPLNVLRLIQIKRLIRQVEESAKGDLDIKVLLPHMKRLKGRKAEILFRKGDEADSIYYVAAGELWLKEINIFVPAGEVIGEIGLFSPDRIRTATAVCAKDCDLYVLSAHKIHEHYYQNPAFAFAVLRLITARLLQNLHNETPSQAPRVQDAEPARPPAPGLKRTLLREDEA
jgi:hypothetical protein